MRHQLAFAICMLMFGCVGGVADNTSSDVHTLLTQERELDRRCRGTEGASNPAVCDERNAMSKRLNELGQCYGRKGEYGYQNEWHVCGPTSIRVK